MRCAINNFFRVLALAAGIAASGSALAQECGSTPSLMTAATNQKVFVNDGGGVVMAVNVDAPLLVNGRWVSAGKLDAAGGVGADYLKRVENFGARFETLDGGAGALRGMTFPGQKIKVDATDPVIQGWLTNLAFQRYWKLLAAESLTACDPAVQLQLFEQAKLLASQQKSCEIDGASVRVLGHVPRSWSCTTANFEVF